MPPASPAQGTHEMSHARTSASNDRIVAPPFRSRHQAANRNKPRYSLGNVDAPGVEGHDRGTIGALRAAYGLGESTRTRGHRMIFLDVEATGTDLAQDRILERALLEAEPDGEGG